MRATEPPTDAIPVWTQPDGVDVAVGRAAVELAVRGGIALMATGAAASDVVASVLRLTAAYGLRSVHVDVTFSALTVSYNRGPNADPLTMTRVVRARNQDFTRLSRLHDVVDQVATDPMSVQDARERFDAVIHAPHPYRRWVTTVATGAMGAGTSLLAGGGWVVVLTSIVSAAVIFRTLTTLGRRGIPGFFAQAIGAAVPTVFAIGLALVQESTSLMEGVLPSLVVASGIVVLLAGLSLVGAAQDAIEGFYVTAGARVFQVIVLTLGIVVGIVVVLGVANRLGVVLAISPESQILAGPVVQLVAAAIIAAGWAISSLHERPQRARHGARRGDRLAGQPPRHERRDQCGVRRRVRRVGDRLRDTADPAAVPVLGARGDDGGYRAAAPGPRGLPGTVRDRQRRERFRALPGARDPARRGRYRDGACRRCLAGHVCGPPRHPDRAHAGRPAHPFLSVSNGTRR